MTGPRTVVMRVDLVTRGRSSRCGNPSYRLYGVDTDTGARVTWATGPNSACAYDVPNVFGTHLDRVRVVTVVLDGRDRVIGIVPWHRPFGEGTVHRIDTGRVAQ